MNLMMLLEMAASAHGDEQLTYAELFTAAGAAADTLSQSGAEQLAVLDVSSPAVPVGLFASAWAGRPFVPLNYRLTGDELESLIERISPSLLVTESSRAADLDSLPGARVLARESFLESARGAGARDASWSMEPVVSSQVAP